MLFGKISPEKKYFFNLRSLHLMRNTYELTDFEGLQISMSKFCSGMKKRK